MSESARSRSSTKSPGMGFGCPHLLARFRELSYDAELKVGANTRRLYRQVPCAVVNRKAFCEIEKMRRRRHNEDVKRAQSSDNI